jgi:hypothetical protein
VALLAFVTVLGGGMAFASADKKPTSWDGIWWAATTMTTVGYGDLYPQTDAGRVIGMLVMVVGIGVRVGPCGCGRRTVRCPEHVLRTAWNELFERRWRRVVRAGARTSAIRSSPPPARSAS